MSNYDIKIPYEFNNNYKFLRGGIGDILIRLGNIIPEEYYVVISHYTDASKLVEKYTANFQYIYMHTPIGQMDLEVSPMYYHKLRIPESSIIKAKKLCPKKKHRIGIHPIGSKLSLVVDYHSSRPQKYIPPIFIENLLKEFNNKDIEFILFCAKDEVELFNKLPIKIVSEDNIWDTIAVVNTCDIVLGVESAIKTVSSMLNIPTIVLLGDYEDSYRKYFIDPYKEIKSIYFKNILNVYNKTVISLREILNKITNI